MKSLPISVILAVLLAASMDLSVPADVGAAESAEVGRNAPPSVLEESVKLIEIDERISVETKKLKVVDEVQSALEVSDRERNRSAQPDAVAVFRSSFEDQSDIDLDGWPDGWERERGPDYPWYVKIGIQQQAGGEQALRIELNGAAGAAYSPRISVRPQFSYVFSGHIKTEGLKADHAYYSVTFFDSEHHVLETFVTAKVQSEVQWQQLSVGPMTLKSGRVDHAVIGVHLTPGVTADLTGSASFDQLWLGRLPSMTLSTNRPHNIYTNPQDIEVSCKISGIAERDPIVGFQILDILGREIASHSTTPLGEEPQNIGDTDGTEPIFQSATSWKPVLKEPGYYQLRCTLRCREGLVLDRQQSLVLLEPMPTPEAGEFGWTLPQGDRQLSFSALEKILPQMGINWVKLPMWVSDSESQRLDQLVGFAERMSSRGIETVGILSEPPAEARAQFGETSTFYAADMFSTEPELWYPLLEPVMARLSLQVRWWQLGKDNDVSFVGYPTLLPTINRIKSELQRFGQEVHLGFGWRLFDQQVAEQNLPWDFLTLSSSPQVTNTELQDYLSAFDGERARRWVSIEPLSGEQYSAETRAVDLIHRMLAAKMSHAEGVFISDPFSATNGLLNADGTPGELLLPWRTTALVLAGSRYLGSIQLPLGSQNHLFERDGKIMMVVWNQRNCEEKIFLGDNLRVTDVWGRSAAPARQDQDSLLGVGPLPSFVSGINPAVLHWNMSAQIQRSTLPSVFGISHDNALILKNTFGQGVSVKARLNFPENWKVVPRVLDFKMATGEEAMQPFGIALPYDAGSGRESVRIDFDVNADQRYVFSVYRELNVGEGDVVLDVASHLNEQGELEIEQFVINNTDQSVSFKCFLFIPDRRRLMTQVIELVQDRDRKVYRLPNGNELLGKTLWLRAEEINGNRTLNRQFIAVE